MSLYTQCICACTLSVHEHIHSVDKHVHSVYRDIYTQYICCTLSAYDVETWFS